MNILNLVITTKVRQQAREQREYLRGLAIGLSHGQIIGQTATINREPKLAPQVKQDILNILISTQGN